MAAGLITSLVIRRSVAIPLQPIKNVDWIALAGTAAATTVVAALGTNLSLPVPTASLALIAVSLLAFPLTRALRARGIASKPALLASAIGIVTAVGLMATRAGDVTSAVASTCVCGTWFLIGAWAALRG